MCMMHYIKCDNYKYTIPIVLLLFLSSTIEKHQKKEYGIFFFFIDYLLAIFQKGVRKLLVKFVGNLGRKMSYRVWW